MVSIFLFIGLKQISIGVINGTRRGVVSEVFLIIEVLKIESGQGTELGLLASHSLNQAKQNDTILLNSVEPASDFEEIAPVLLS